MTDKKKTYTAPNKPIFVPEGERLIENDQILIPSENIQEILNNREKATEPIISLQN